MNIEEIAFKDRKNLVQLNENNLLDIIEFLQQDRKQWINQFTQTHNESVKIQEENQELKDNWNKLKIWLEEYNIANEKWYSNELSNHDREYYKKDYLDCKFFINKFIDKMQELEQGSYEED